MGLKSTISPAFSWVRVVPLLLAVWIGLGSSLTSVDAQRSAALQTPLTRFNGQITNMVGPADNPTGFTLMVRSRLIEMHLAPTANVVPLSAEAKLAGLQVNDYAIVLARRVRKDWVAYRVQFDVQPIVQGPPLVTVTGTVLKVVTIGRRFQMRTDAGDVRWIFIVPKTTFRIDGQLQTGPPALSKGDVVQVSARWLNHRWIAVEINLESTNPFLG